MLRYIASRFVVALPVVLLVILITFTLGYYAPGDPIALIYNENITNMTPDDLERLHRQYGLDRPYLVQYFDYMSKVLRGDLGTSIATKQPVLDMIRIALPITLQLGLAAAVLLIVLGIPLGVLAALRHNTWLDYTIVSSSLFLRTIPIFVLAPMLMIFFVLQLGILDVPLGWNGLLDSRVILPIVLLAAGPLADVVRQTRVAVLEVLGQDYVNAARAKGLKTHMIVTRHIMRNALIPIVTSLGLIVNGLIHGSVFLDRVFSLPGFGSIVVNGIQLLDFPVILGTTIFGALLVIGANILVDLIYPYIDPRVKLD
jgi:peptide/nickel transport system permease protein